MHASQPRITTTHHNHASQPRITTTRHARITSRHPRWLQVGRELLQRPFYWDKVQSALALTPEEQEDFLQKLGARDLAADCEERTVVHLLLRADSINRSKIDWRRLKVRVVSWAWGRAGGCGRNGSLGNKLLEE
jgi:hypothetical protein